jgi:hypothetical protein
MMTFCFGFYFKCASTSNSEKLKGLSHEMGLELCWHACTDLGLNNRKGRFLNILDAQHCSAFTVEQKYFLIFRAVNANPTPLDYVIRPYF